jgi:hypothetical protein
VSLQVLIVGRQWWEAVVAIAAVAAPIANHFAAYDLPQRVIKVRKVIDGHIAYKRAANFVVTRAAMQPSDEN